MGKIRQQRSCALSATMPDFLWQFALENLLWRLEMTLRQFPQCLLINEAPSSLADALAKLGKFSDIQSQDIATDFNPDAMALAPESLDAIIWLQGLEQINDVPGSLIQIRRALKPDGLFLATSLGGETLQELRASWLAADSAMGGASPRVAPMIDVRSWGGLLQRAGFALPVVDRELLDVTYADPLTLMHEIKAMGLGHGLLQGPKGLTTPRAMMRACEYYQKEFQGADGRLKASFEIITLTGWAPHENQQQPLKPGSAKMRLIDALNPRKT